MTDSDTPEAPAPPEAPRERNITDARAMRALAHPVRVSLMQLLAQEGQLTATRAAEVLGESPGNMSWHLQTLARYGLVEEVEGVRGRSRPWRVVSASHSIETVSAAPEVVRAAQALEESFQVRSNEMQREWWSARSSYPEEWQRAAFTFDIVSHLTADEVNELSAEINNLIARFRGRGRDHSMRPPGALPIHLTANCHPLPAADGD